MTAEDKNYVVAHIQNILAGATADMPKDQFTAIVIKNFKAFVNQGAEGMDKFRAVKNFISCFVKELEANDLETIETAVYNHNHAIDLSDKQKYQYFDFLISFEIMAIMPMLKQVVPEFAWENRNELLNVKP